MAKKLFEKAGLIHLPPSRPADADDAAVADTDRAKAKTAPGSMLQFMTAQSAAVKEAEGLRERLAEFDGSSPVRWLDAATIRVSVWANRHADSFSDAEFEALKAEISAAGGNVQPIKVRPIVNAVVASSASSTSGRGVGRSNGGDAGAGAGEVKVVYEIVFGHRRHRACLELGLPVLAMIEAVDEQSLFVQMERENRQRKDLSAWEQGRMYARALDGGLYPSNRQLAAAIGRDLGDVGKALALARLPQAVVDAFSSPLDLQFRWAKPLSDAQQRDPDALVGRARAVRADNSRLNARQVFERLIESTPTRGASIESTTEIAVRVAGRQVASVRGDAQGRTTVVFTQAMTDEQRQQLAKAIEDFLARGNAG